MNDLSREILAYSLQNASEFGKADAGRVMPKLFQHGLQKEDIKKIMPIVQEAVKKVNSMKESERAEAFAKLGNVVKKYAEKEKDLPEIDVKGLKKIVTRMAPEPSKYLHLGHAMTFLINYMYAKKYNGACLLRMEDANPEKVSKEYVDAIIEDIRDFLGIKSAKVRYVSDDMPVFHTYAEQLMDKGHAYICFCNRDKMQKLRHDGVECECRNFPKKIQIARWKMFVKGKYKVGEAVMRFRGDMQSSNHVMRDSVLFRRLDVKHYRHGTKYKVWPMYDFYNPIGDSLMGVTLILRSNEFDMRVELQDKLKELLGLKKQKIVQYGRFNVEDFTTKGREIREMFESGELRGWDDPRLITLRALRRRGIQREALYELTKQIGLSQHQVNLQFDMLAAINRKIVDPIADRYSFVREPVKIDVVNAPMIKEVEIKIHPDKKEKKKISVKDIYISGEDYKKFMGKEVRLLHLYNINLTDKKASVSSIDIKDIPKINWVSEGIKARVLMPDGKWAEGLVEPGAKKLKKDAIVQFERFGFVRYDGVHNKIPEFWFAHT